jgi:hypothetical protein
MSDISIQFHATPKELNSFVEEWVRDLSLNVVAVHISPFQASTIGEIELGSLLFNDSNTHSLIFTMDEPALVASSVNDLFESNPDKLRLDVGKLDEAGLNQSWLSARTENFGALAAWNEIARRLKAVTHSGVLEAAKQPGKSNSYCLGGGFHPDTQTDDRCSNTCPGVDRCR